MADKLEIVFCDIDGKFIDVVHREASLPENFALQKMLTFKFLHSDIRSLNKKNAVFVSPANCIGSMGGGIDEIYSRKMFPNIHKEIMDKISKLETTMDFRDRFDGLEPCKDKPILPIGEAMITSLKKYPKYETCYIVTAPTMETPRAVQDTQNARLAMEAVLKIVLENRKDLKITTIIIPGLCTGVGCMLESESACQIFSALCKYFK